LTKPSLAAARSLTGELSSAPFVTNTVTTDDDTQHLLVPAVLDAQGHHRPASPSEHGGDAVHGIAERQGDDEVDLVNVLPHQLGHKSGQATAAPARGTQCGKLVRQNLVLALVHTPRPSRAGPVHGISRTPLSGGTLPGSGAG
jgi:hypothetical protein